MGYPSPVQRLAIDAAEALVRSAMAGNDPSHDFEHVDRVRRNALRIARNLLEAGEEVDLLSVELAGLFHDLLDDKYRTSAQAGLTVADLLADFFEAHADAVSTDQAALICRVAENVSWSKEKRMHAEGKLEPWHETCKELHCVQDGDRIEAIGAVGIFRCAAYSGASRRGSIRDFIDHFHEKLFLIEGQRLKTALGRELAEGRQAIMRSFIQDLERELNCLD